MIYLFGAIAANLCMTFLMRYSETHDGNRYALNIWNYFAGTIFSFFLLTDKANLIMISDHGITLFSGVFNGILYVVSLIAIQFSIRRNGAPLTSTFNRLGVLIPTILSAILFLEIPKPVQILGLALSVFAIIYMNMGSKEDLPSFRLGLILIFILGGLGDFINKIYSTYYDAEAQKYFLMYTFFFATLVSIVTFIKDGGKMSLRDAIIGIGVGIPNQLTSLLVLKASMSLPAFMVYPTYSAGIILFVNVINYLVFREKLSKRQYLATAVIGVALICINI